MKTSDTTLRIALQSWRDQVEEELFQHVTPFWLAHSIDREHGGYHDHLDRDGTPFDSKKHVGLQAQALWVWSRMCADLRPEPAWNEAARHGVEWLRRHARREDGRVWSVTTRDGRPVKVGSNPRDELFVAAALLEYARGCDPSATDEACKALDDALALALDPLRYAGPQPEGAVPKSDLDTVTLALDALDSLERLAPGASAERSRSWLKRASLHVRPEMDLVLENVGLDGAVLDGPEGRLVCPGRALLAAQRMFEHAAHAGDTRAIEQALATMESSLDFGWDADDGGLFLYLDRDGLSPVQIEWSRKLAWVHGAALVATLTAYATTHTPRWLERFEQLADFVFARFPDPVHGEWFASLDRLGRVCQRFKTGPRKGGWAALRSLVACLQLMPV